MALSDVKMIAIDGDELYRPPAFAPQMEDIYAGEYTTCTGKIVGDKVGWRYSDMTLQWDALPQSMVNYLTGMDGECTLEFEDLSGTVTSEQVIRTSAVMLRNRNTLRGEVWWLDVSVSIRFINAHN